jgi:hypothetical protein
MTFFLAGLLAAGFCFGTFGPNIRIDHENRASHQCFNVSLTTGPSDSGPQPIYAAIQNDSVTGMVSVREDIYFQRSLDGGLTWLPDDRLVRRGADFACYPDITTDRSGGVYIIYVERVPGSSGSGHCYVVRSSDGGNNWTAPSRADDNSSPVPTGWTRLVADTAGNLFAAWNDKRTSYMRIWSSVSTDQGATWQTNVRVDDDTVSSDEFQPDVAIQPGTNAYLATATYPYFVRPGNISSHAMFTRSLDQGRTFEPCVMLDTFRYYCGQPHVIADIGHIVTDFTGSGSGSSNQNHTQASTSSDGGLTWTYPVDVTNLETLYSTYYNGAKLAIDADGGVHTGLLVCDLATYNYDIYYARSSDYGLNWSDRELVNDIQSGSQMDPDITVDGSGFAYLAWQDQRNTRNEIWFAANKVSGAAEPRRMSATGCLPLSASPNPFRDKVTFLVPSVSDRRQPGIRIYDLSGHLVRSLPLPDAQRRTPSAASSLTWDAFDDQGHRCPPGVYLATAGSTTTATTKIVLLN